VKTEADMMCNSLCDLLCSRYHAHMMRLAVLDWNSAVEAAALAAATSLPEARAAASACASSFRSCHPSDIATIAGATSTSASTPWGQQQTMGFRCVRSCKLVPACLCGIVRMTVNL
jgi:hypothetical protein